MLRQTDCVDHVGRGRQKIMRLLLLLLLLLLRMILRVGRGSTHGRDVQGRLLLIVGPFLLLLRLNVRMVTCDHMLSW